MIYLWRRYCNRKENKKEKAIFQLYNVYLQITESVYNMPLLIGYLSVKKVLSCHNKNQYHTFQNNIIAFWWNKSKKTQLFDGPHWSICAVFQSVLSGGNFNNCFHFVDVNAMKEISSSEVDELIVDGIILVTEKWIIVLYLKLFFCSKLNELQLGYYI